MGAPAKGSWGSYQAWWAEGNRKQGYEKILAIEVALVEESYLEALSRGLLLGHRDVGEALKEGAKALLSP
jgi:hypothetical protein